MVSAKLAVHHLHSHAFLHFLLPLVLPEAFEREDARVLPASLVIAEAWAADLLRQAGRGLAGGCGRHPTAELRAESFEQLMSALRTDDG